MNRSRSSSTVALLAAVAAGAGMSGCKSEISLTLDHAMLIDVLTTGENAVASGVLKFEVPSKRTVAEKGDRIKALLEKYFAVDGEFGVVREGMDTYATIRIRIPIERTGPEQSFQSFEESRNVFAVFVGESNARRKIIFALNRKVLDRLSEESTSEFMTTVDPEKARIRMLYVNSGRDELSLKTGSVYIDGDPEPFTRKVTLRRGQTMQLELSSISVDYLFRKSYMCPLLLFSPQQTGDGGRPPRNDVVETQTEEDAARTPQALLAKIQEGVGGKEPEILLEILAPSLKKRSLQLMLSAAGTIDEAKQIHLGLRGEQGKVLAELQYSMIGMSLAEVASASTERVAGAFLRPLLPGKDAEILELTVDDEAGTAVIRYGDEKGKEGECRLVREDGSWYIGSQ